MNWRCRFGWHHWIWWGETDYALGFHFDYQKCDRPGCKWSGLTWVEKERLHEGPPAAAGGPSSRRY